MTIAPEDQIRHYKAHIRGLQAAGRRRDLSSIHVWDNLMCRLIMLKTVLTCLRSFLVLMTGYQHIHDLKIHDPASLWLEILYAPPSLLRAMTHLPSQALTQAVDSPRCLTLQDRPTTASTTPEMWVSKLVAVLLLSAIPIIPQHR